MCALITTRWGGISGAVGECCFLTPKSENGGGGPSWLELVENYARTTRSRPKGETGETLTSAEMAAQILAGG